MAQASLGTGLTSQVAAARGLFVFSILGRKGKDAFGSQAGNWLRMRISRSENLAGGGTLLGPARNKSP